jgi:hypothetical protein
MSAQTTTGLDHVVAAVAAELAVTQVIAGRIVEENLERLATRRMPAGVSAFGYAGAHGHHLSLMTGDVAIVDLRVSAESISAIEAYRASHRARVTA